MISMIVAVDAEFGIGKNGQIPWHYSEDMKHFARTTKGSTCIMGRVTCEDIMEMHNNPELLPNRESIVVTHNKSFKGRGVIAAPSLGSAIAQATRENVFIIGGAGIYQEALTYIQEAYITFIPCKHGCDVAIPEVIKYIMGNFNCVEKNSSSTGLEFIKVRRQN